MAKVLDVKEFVAEQTQLHAERRTSQHVYFLNKSPFFVTYFHINRTLSTSELSTATIDSYIGPDSPVRYDKINNMPIYGLPVFDGESEFDETLGTNSENWSGEGTIVPGIMEPTEGDCFIIEYFNKRVLFTINNVRESMLKARSHFIITIHIQSMDKISQLEKQVISKSTAIFENIGTENRVILQDDNFKFTTELRKSYREMYDYYVNIFLDSYSNMFMVNRVAAGDLVIKLIDKFTIKFMANNRIVIMDNILKEYKMVDYNGIHVDDELEGYRDTIYFALSNKRINFFKPTDRISFVTTINPFAAYTNSFEDIPKISNKYNILTNDNKVELLSTSIEYDYVKLYDKIRDNNISVNSDIDKIYNLIVKFMNDTELLLDDFKDIQFLNISKLDQYLLYPIVLFIMKSIISEKEVNIANYLTTQ